MTREQREMKKALEEMELRYRKEEGPKAKKARMKEGVSRKVSVLVSNGEALVLGAVFHVLNEDYTGEFDPFYIDRMKNTLQMMKSKNFAEVIEAEIQ
jgi:hypothetical protein